MKNDLTAYDFWGNATWIGGNDMARCERLRLYEKTGMEPLEIRVMKRANDAYRLAGLRYEEEIEKLRREKMTDKSGWISVKDKLPETDDEVLIYTVVGSCDIGRYGWRDYGVWSSEEINAYDDGSITHWMPLPKPPKED